MIAEPMQSAGETKPLLTIAIPTYNRARYLRELLSVLFDQLVAEPRVELIISDNASPDETPALVAEFQERGLSIRSIRNEVNVGADANFLQCFEQARGKYVWIFGDDDVIIPGGVAKILNLLQLEDFSIVYVNPYMFLADYRDEAQSDRYGRHAEILPDGLLLVERVGAMLTFISAVIVNKDIFTAVSSPSLNEALETNLMQMGWTCRLLATSQRTLIVWENLVAGRGGNCAGWGACQVFGVNLREVSERFLGDRIDIVNALCGRTLQGWFPETIMDIRRGKSGGLIPENMHEILKPVFSRNWRYWLYVYPLLTVPLSVASVWYAVILAANRLERFLVTLSGLVFSRHNFVRATQ